MSPQENEIIIRPEGHTFLSAADGVGKIPAPLWPAVYGAKLVYYDGQHAFVWYGHKEVAVFDYCGDFCVNVDFEECKPILDASLSSPTQSR